MTIYSAETDQDLATDTPADGRARGQPSGGTGTQTRTAPRDTGVPLWFEYLVLIGCSAVLSFGGFGLFLAVLGHFSVWSALLLGSIGMIACIVLARPTRRAGARASGAKVTVPALGMCVVALSVTAWNSINIGHHVAVATDPGVYAVAGRWLASHSSLVVPAGAPWSGQGPFSWTSLGMYPRPNGTLQFQFAHLLPVLLAEGHGLGGDALMFRVPAVLNAIALCAIYTTGCRLIKRPWLTLAAVSALAVSLPQLYFSRDTFSEPATQVLLWGGIWLLLRAYETRRVTVGIVAGLALGGTLMTRIDAVAYLIPLPLLAAAAWISARSPDDRKSLLRLYAAVVVGVLPVAILGTIDVQRRATGYYLDLRHSVMELYIALGLSTVGAIVLVVLLKRGSSLRSRLASQRKRISVAAVWVIASALFLAWTLRPIGPARSIGGGVGQVVSNLQRNQNLPVHPESYAEQSMQWISWYIGPIALLLAIAGLCLLTSFAIRRGSPTAVVVLAMAGPLTALYLWNPDITPMQIWAMRRYVPATLPLLLLSAAAAVDFAATASARWFRSKAWPRRVVVAGVAGMIAFPVAATWPVRDFQVQANFLPVVDRTCHSIGPDAAVLFPTNTWNETMLMQTMRSWCGVPAAALTGPISDQQLRAVAAAFHSDGRQLWLLGDATLIKQADPALTPTLIGSATSSRELEQTVERPPDDYDQSVLTVYGAQVR